MIFRGGAFLSELLPALSLGGATGLLRTLRSGSSASPLLRRGFEHSAGGISPGVESPIHPMPETCRWDAIGARVRHPLSLDELPLRSTVRQGIERCDEISDRPAGNEEVFSEEPQMLV